MVTTMDGKAVASQVEAELSERSRVIEQRRGWPPGLGVILVGDDEASQVYVRNKVKACERVGMASEVIRFPAEVSQEEVEAAVQRCNGDDAIDAMLIQWPVPPHIDYRQLMARVSPVKDADGFHPEHLGRLLEGHPERVPCTPKGILRLLDTYDIEIDGRRSVVVGRSPIVGRPLAVLLINRHSTVTVCHSHTQQLADQTRQADILVAAAGQRHLIGPEMVKPGAAVIDVGIHRTGSGLDGDVAYEAVEKVASAITPVPGGVGPMTVAMLLENTVEAAEAAGTSGENRHGNHP